MKIVMPRSTLRQMHNVVHYIVNHVATPPLVVFSNVVDDLAEKRLLRDVLQGRPRAITIALQSLLEDMDLIQRRIHETSRGSTAVAFASPPGFVFWEKKPLQLLVYAMWELSKVERRDMREEIIYHFRICAPNLRVQPDSLRLPEMANPAFFAEVSKFVQRNFFIGNAANLTKDDAMCYDYGMWIAERIYQDKQWWIANTNMRRSLDDNFALTPAKDSCDSYERTNSERN